MDPLYANLDKRNTSADQQKVPAPQPTAYSMPDFGRQNDMSENLEQPTQPEPNQSIISTPDLEESIRPIDPTPKAKAEVPETPIMAPPTKPIVAGSKDIILNIDQPKKSKKWPIVATTVAAILSATVILIVVLIIPKVSPKEAFSKLQEKIAMIEPEIVSRNSLSYYKDLKNDIIVLENSIKRSSGYSGSGKEEILSQIEELSQETTLLIISNKLVYSDDALLFYINNNTLDDVFTEYDFPIEEPENSLLDNAQSVLEQYIYNKKIVLDIESDNGCISDGQIEHECTEQLNIDNADYSQYVSRMKDFSSLVELNRNIILEFLENNIKDIEIKIKEEQ